MEAPYSNREIREMFGDIKAQLTRIETQTTKTNGRVTEIEKREAGSEGASGVWLYIGVSGALALLGWAAWISLHFLSA